MNPFDHVNWRVAMWIPVGLATARFGNRPGRRATLRAAVSVATAAVLGRAAYAVDSSGRRGWGSLVRIDGAHSRPAVATAAAYATATAIEAPRLAAPIGLVAAAAIASTTRNSRSGGAELIGATVLGVAAAAATLRVWPRTQHADVVPSSAPATTADHVSATGAGLSIVVNSSAGDPAHDEIIAMIERDLPDVSIVRVDDVARLDEELARVAQASEAIGAIGGDGTVGATAAAALDAGIPLAVFPGGTLNHFARDARVDTVDDAIRAVQNRRLVSIDTGLADGRTFVNTTSLGSYSTLVELREQHEKTIGKWPAVVLALLQILVDSTPFSLSINGERRRIWMIFIGNCSYEPAGFAPSARNRLDDGLFDVRIVDADHPFARLHLIAALLTGGLARSAVYSRTLVERIDIEVDDAAPLLAADGEVFPAGARSFAITKNPQPLRLFVAAEEE